MFEFHIQRMYPFIPGKKAKATKSKESLSFYISKQFILIPENLWSLNIAFSLQGVIETPFAWDQTQGKLPELEYTSQFNLKQPSEESMSLVCLLVYFLIQHLPTNCLVKAPN